MTNTKTWQIRITNHTTNHTETITLPHCNHTQAERIHQIVQDTERGRATVTLTTT